MPVGAAVTEETRERFVAHEIRVVGVDISKLNLGSASSHGEAFVKKAPQGKSADYQGAVTVNTHLNYIVNHLVRWSKTSFQDATDNLQNSVTEIRESRHLRQLRFFHYLL